VRNLGRVCLWLLLVLIATPALPAGAGEKMLRVGVNDADIATLDPARGVQTSDMHIMASVFNGLVRLPPGEVNLDRIEPDLVERWQVSADGRDYTFIVRKGVQFHRNYGELTAEDVVYSLKRAADKTRSNFFKTFEEIESVTAADRYTVKIHLKSFVPSFLGSLIPYRGGQIISKKAGEELGDGFKANPVGTGPFAFQRYAAKQFVELRAHKAYFRGTPQLDGVIYRFMPDLSTRELAFDQGELDIIEGIKEQRWVDRMRSKPNTVMNILGPGELACVFINLDKKPLDDVRVRRALAHAVDRNEMLAVIGKLLAAPTLGPLPLGYQGGVDEGLPGYEYNPEKAKALLKEARQENLSISIVMSQRSSFVRPMEILQEQFRRVGVELRIDPVDHNAYHAQIRKDVNALVLYIAARFPVAEPYLTEFFHSRHIVGTPTAVTNFSHYKGVDAELDKAAHEVDTKKRFALWRTAQEKIMEDAVAIPLYVLKAPYALRSTVDLGYEAKSSLFLGPEYTQATTLR
jgi:peptide/nickel transport system substrate-binding protein